MSDKSAEMGIKQIGLHSNSEKEIEQLVQRVSKFNLNHLGSAIKMDILPCEEGDRDNPDPHYKINFFYPNKQVMRDFWLK